MQTLGFWNLDWYGDWGQVTAPALLGLARCDDFAPGIGQRKLSSIRLDEGTTPERRFVASRDLDGNGREMLWQKPW